MRAIAALLLTASAALCLVSCASMGLIPNAQAEFDAGFSRFSQGNYQGAVQHFKKATEAEPRFAKAYLYLGRSYLAMGKYIEAIPPLRAAYELAPEETRQETFNLVLDALLSASQQTR
jgi:tetratricopeptide (TPR) repeat protein